MPSFFDKCQDIVERLPDIASRLFYIRTETGGVALCQPNTVQADYHADRTKRGFASHDVIDKARKHGFSTWKELEGLALTLFVDGFSGLIMADEKEKTKKLFNIAKLAYDRLPEDLKKQRKLDTDRTDIIRIGASSLYVVTASGKDPARSDTLHWVHLTEVAFYEDWDKIRAGINEAMAESGAAAHRCMESTARGRNHWYDLCKAARDGNSPDKLYFYEWWWSPKYSLPLAPGETIFPSPEEEAVIAIAAHGGFKITPEQLKWRRWKNLPTELGAQREEEEAEFAQEYPEDFESSFLVGGRPLFKAALLKQLSMEAEAHYVLEREFLPGNGERLVWRKPNNNGSYVVAVDVAEGKAHGDWSVISTWEKSREGFINVARTKVKCSLSDLAYRVTEEARLYRQALVSIEQNSVGAAVLQKLEEDYHYPNVYRREVDGELTDSRGWHTSQKSKRIMISEFRDGINTGSILTWDPELVGQMMNIQLDDLGRPVTPAKKHDDIFMAACIATMARDQAVSSGDIYSGVFGPGSAVSLTPLQDTGDLMSEEDKAAELARRALV